MACFLLALPLQGQKITVSVQGEEIASGRYSKEFIDIGYTASAAVTVRAYVNGVPQELGEAKGVRPGARKVRLSGLPKVDYEPCRIRLEFLDSRQRVVDTKEFYLQYKDPRRNLYMYSIGVGGKLKDSSFAELLFPRLDARKVSDCFLEYSSAYYIRKEVRLFSEPEETTRDYLARKLNQLANEIQTGDVFMLYLSGHGEEENGEFYFITYDAHHARLSQTALSGEEIRSFIHRITAKQADVYVFVDACHAEALFQKDTDSRGTVYFASCQKDEISAESKRWQNSVYANALTDALSGKDGSAQIGNGYITIASLQDCLYAKVRRETGFSQNPVCYYPGFAEDHVLFQAASVTEPTVIVPVTTPRPPAQSTPVTSADMDAQYQAGMRAYDARDFATAFRLLLPLAQKGYQKAFFPVAEMYHGGRGVKKDKAESEKWYQKAADTGNAKARSILLNM